MFRHSFWALALCTFGIANQAQAEFNLYGDMQFAFGGDELADVEIVYKDGDRERQSIDAGEGFSFALGTRFDISGNFDGVLAFGYKTAAVTAGKDSVDFDRTFLNGMLLYNAGRLQLGAGFINEMGPKLDLKDAGDGSYKFDDALGTVLELGYNFGDNLILALRHTSIDYEPRNVSGVSFDGNNFAISLAATF